jgi:hypothetical protein
MDSYSLKISHDAGYLQEIGESVGYLYDASIGIIS